MTTLQWLLLTGAVTLVLGFYLYGRRLQDEDPWQGLDHDEEGDEHLDYQARKPAAPAEDYPQPRDAFTDPGIPGAKEWAQGRDPSFDDRDQGDNDQDHQPAPPPRPPVRHRVGDDRDIAASYDGPMPDPARVYPHDTSVVRAAPRADDTGKGQTQPEPPPLRLRADARPKRKARWSFLARKEPSVDGAAEAFDGFDDDPIDGADDGMPTRIVDPAVEEEFERQNKAQSLSRREPAVDAPATGPSWLKGPTVEDAPEDEDDATEAAPQQRRAPAVEQRPAPAPDPQLGLNIENERPGAKAEQRVKNVPDGEEKIVILHVRARNGQKFEGPAIHAALQLCRLKFGMRNIYHRVTEVNGVPEVVFSCASMVKPGYLDPAESQGFETPGLTFFMVLPGPIDGVAAFRDLLNTADKLALRLGGEVLDETRTRITHQSAQFMRDEIAELERQWRVPTARKR